MQTDSPWKEILDEYFPDFTQLLFPELYAVVDWSRGFTPLDKELQSLDPGPVRKRGGGKGTLIVDKLMRVYGRGGKHMLILVHVEIQAQHQAEFARRMYEYHARIVGKHRAPVVSMAVLADRDPKWRPSSYEHKLGGCKELLEFPIAKLLDFRGREKELKSSTNRFAIVILAYLKAQKVEGNAELMFNWKLELSKWLSTRGTKEQAQLLQFVDFMFPLSSTLEERYWRTFSTSEEGKSMAYVTSFERISIKKGIKQGLEQGRLDQARDLVLEALEVRFGAADPSVRAKVQSVCDLDTLGALHRQAITARSLSEFVSGLE